jgi:type II secretory pathway component PulF
MNADAPKPVLSYADQSDTGSFTLGRYVAHLLAGVLLLAIVAVPMVWVQRVERVYSDFKLTLPAFTRWLLVAGNWAEQTRAYVWIWVLPALLPLLTMRLSSAARRRVFALLLLAALLLTVGVVIAMVEPV